MSAWDRPRPIQKVGSPRWSAETQHFRIRGPPRQLHQVRCSGSRDQSRFRASVQASRYFTEMPRVAAKAATRACQQRRPGVRIPSAGFRSTDPPMQARCRARECRSRGVSVSRDFGPAGVTLRLPGRRTLIGHFPRSSWVETAPDAPSGPGTVDGVSNATRGIGPGQRLFHGETSRDLEVLALGARVHGCRGSGVRVPSAPPNSWLHVSETSQRPRPCRC